MQIIAIDKMKTGVTEAEITPYLPAELVATVKMYLEEKIRAWYFRKDKIGVVFMLEFESVETAKEAMSKLPLVEAGLLDFDYIPVGPLEPLGLLIAPKS